MHGWLPITAAAAAVSTVVVVLLVIFRRCSSSSSSSSMQQNNSGNTNRGRTESIQSGIAKLHHVNLHHQIDIENAKKTNYYVFRRDASARPLFSWSDHPSLVTDAVEYGWSRFAFTASVTSSPSIRSAKPSLLGACAGIEPGRETDVETSWEVCQGSADFMQKIRLNSGLRKINFGNSPMAAASVVKSALPLPGPPLGNSSFPQEAYFEITILNSGENGDDLLGNRRKIRSESEKAKLIQQNSSGKGNSESFIHGTSVNGNKKLEELKFGSGKDERKLEEIVMSIGLARGGPLPLKLPGSYPGSVGFNSNGSVYIDGIKLVLESQKQEWGKPDRVIGCGYNPVQRKVFFTIDSQLIHVISCKSEEFGTPIYPTLAANADIMVLVNFGQSPFKYSSANAQRTPNPCFIGPLANSPALGYEDSRELFSMGRIDAQWLNRSGTKSSVNTYGSNNKGMDFDEESEGDLFEIVLESNGKSPNTVLQRENVQK